MRTEGSAPAAGERSPDARFLSAARMAHLVDFGSWCAQLGVTIASGAGVSGPWRWVLGGAGVVAVLSCRRIVEARVASRCCREIGRLDGEEHTSIASEFTHARVLSEEFSILRHPVVCLWFLWGRMALTVVVLLYVTVAGLIVIESG